MKLPQLLHSTRSYGRANSAFSWKLLVLERGFLSYRLKLPCDRSAKDAWFGYSPVGALRKLPFILCSRPAEDWLQRLGGVSLPKRRVLPQRIPKCDQCSKIRMIMLDDLQVMSARR